MSPLGACHTSSFSVSTHIRKLRLGDQKIFWGCKNIKVLNFQIEYSYLINSNILPRSIAFCWQWFTFLYALRGEYSIRKVPLFVYFLKYNLKIFKVKKTNIDIVKSQRRQQFSEKTCDREKCEEEKRAVLFRA